jgi:hypothetical protein
MYAGFLALRVAMDVLPRFGFRVSSGWFVAFMGALSAAHLFIVMSWVYVAWKGIPASHRGTMTPWRAVATFFIPVYDVYWAFAMNRALCDTLDGILASAGSDRRAPRTLGTVACATWVTFAAIGLVLATADPLNGGAGTSMMVAQGSLWLAYMLLCDRARDEVARLAGDPSALGAPRLSRIQRKKGPHPVAAIAVSIILMVGFLGCWQILQPTERVPASSPTRTHAR